MYRGNTWTRSGSRLVNARCKLLSHNTKKGPLSKSVGTRSSSSSSSKSTGNGIYLSASVATIGVLGTAAVAYASYDDEFRSSLERSVPFTKGVLKTLLGERKSKQNLLTDEKDLSIPFEIPVTKEGEALSDKTSTPVFADEITHAPSETPAADLLSLNTLDTPGVSAIDLELSNRTPTKSEEIKTEPIKAGKEENLSSKEEVPTPEISSVIPTDSKAEDDEKSVEAVIPTETEQSDVSTGPLTSEEINQLSQVVDQSALEVVLDASAEQLKILSTSTITSYNQATASIREYIQQLSEAVSVPNKEDAYKSVWAATALLEHRSQQVIDEAVSKERELKVELEGLMELMKSVRQAGFSEVATRTEELVKLCKEKLDSVHNEMQKAEGELKFFLDFQAVVENAAPKLQEELKRFTPDLLKLMKLREEFQDLSLKEALLALALKRPEVFQGKASEDTVANSEKFTDVIAKQKEELKKRSEENLKSEISRIETEMDLKLQSKVKDVESHYENEILAQLKRQASAHNEHLAEELAKKSSEVTAMLKDEMNTKLSEKHEIYRQELEKNVAAIDGIQSKITDIVDVDRYQRRLQELWIASQALNAALEESVVHGRTRTLMPEMVSIMHLGGKNEVIQEIIETIPEAAAMYGVVPEKDLLQRFDRVKGVCKKVALVGEEGGSVGHYLLSFVKSIFVYTGWYRRSFGNEINPDEIGPYEILAKADYFVEQGDLEQAAKFMSLLKGASRQMCNDWLVEVRLLLETKQTAQLLLSYAASLSAGGG